MSVMLGQEPSSNIIERVRYTNNFNQNMFNTINLLILYFMPPLPILSLFCYNLYGEQYIVHYQLIKLLWLRGLTFWGYLEFVGKIDAVQILSEK